MYEKEMQKLANNLVNKSVKAQKGERVLIDYSCTDKLFIRFLIEEIIKVGAVPQIWNTNKYLKKQIILNGTEDTFNKMAEIDSFTMQNSDCVIIVRGEENLFDFTDVPIQKQKLFSICYDKKVHNDIRLNKKWVLLRFPSPSFAQSAHLSTEAFNTFYYKVCNYNYENLKEKMEPLKKLMEKTDKVRIIAKDTDLVFSIKDIPAIKCCGECNIPDGEIYTAPVKNSINGQIRFNVNASIDGNFYSTILLKFKDGKIIDCDDFRFEKILDTDEGSRYIGEFAFGLNNAIVHPVLDILFDEKMAKSIHMAVGNSYDDAPNGNKSAVHIDLIQCHSKDYGGGEIYFDDVLIRKNGEFLLEELQPLNRI